MLTGKVGKQRNVLPGEVVESPFSEIFHNPAGQDPEQHALPSPLASFWRVGLYRWPPELHSKIHFSMTPWFFSKAYGHLIPIAVVNPTHISSSQGHVLSPRGQAAWGNCFFIVVGFWNLSWLMYALCQVILCKLWNKFLQLCLCEQIKHHWGLFLAVQVYQLYYSIFSVASGIFLVHDEQHSSPPTQNDLKHKFGNWQELLFLLTVASLFWSLVELTVWILAVPWPKCHQVALDVFWFTIVDTASASREL